MSMAFYLELAMGHGYYWALVCIALKAAFLVEKGIWWIFVHEPFEGPVPLNR